MAEDDAPMREPAPGERAQIVRPQRPRELDDALNHYLYHPLAWRLARALAPTPVTPNMVSIAGGGCVVLAALLYAQTRWWPWSALAGMAAHMAWHVVDGADGDLARITRRTSPLGEMIDGICDYVGHVVLYLVLGWLLMRQWPAHPLLAWLLMLAAAVSHIVQTNHAEVQRRSYQWWIYAKPWLRNTHAAAGAATQRHIYGGFAKFYLATAHRFAAGAEAVDRAVADADPAQLARIRTAVRAEAPPLLRLEQLVGPNPRAIILGGSMLLGSPVWYFLALIGPMNALLAWSVVRHDRAATRILAAAR